MPVSPKTQVAASRIATAIGSAPRQHTNDYPLWAGPCGTGPLGGITQSMLVRFLSCRERFRLKYVLGLEPHDRWTKTLGYGNMWHLCEEVFAGDPRGLTGVWQSKLVDHCMVEINKHPMQRVEIEKWFQVCLMQFPEYVVHWQHHPDVQSRVPLMQEQVFDVPYTLPSGRVVRLRGKFDSVDLIDDAIYLQENKSKGDIDKQDVERQLKFDLQTMLYLIALKSQQCMDGIRVALQHHGLSDAPITVNGVRYNVVRRPLSGGKGSIKQGEGTKGSKCSKCKGEGKYTPKRGLGAGCLASCEKCSGAGRTGAKPPESDEEFYGRLREYIVADPSHFFFRVRSEVSEHDIEVFKRTCLDPLLETLCLWYELATNTLNADAVHLLRYLRMNYRTPFGVYSALEEGGSTEYDAYLETGSEAGLRRTEQLFTELQC